MIVLCPNCQRQVDCTGVSGGIACPHCRQPFSVAPPTARILDSMEETASQPADEEFPSPFSISDTSRSSLRVRGTKPEPNQLYLAIGGVLGLAVAVALGAYLLFQSSLGGHHRRSFDLFFAEICNRTRTIDGKPFTLKDNLKGVAMVNILEKPEGVLAEVTVIPVTNGPLNSPLLVAYEYTDERWRFSLQRSAILLKLAGDEGYSSRAYFDPENVGKGSLEDALTIMFSE